MSAIVIPDWTEIEYYNLLEKNTDSTNWGWEFLRRNIDYQRDFFTYFSPEFDISDDEYEKFENDLHNGAIPMHPYLVCDPAGLPEETRPQYLKRMNGKAWIISSREKFLQKKYGIFPADPNKSNAIALFDHGVSIQAAHSKDLSGLAPIRIEETSEVIVKFDLNRPLPEQIKKAKYMLDMAQKSLNRKGLCSTYKGKLNNIGLTLRVLDALLSGVESPAKIAKVIYPQENNKAASNTDIARISDVIKNAKSYSKERYKYFHKLKTTGYKK